MPQPVSPPPPASLSEPVDGSVSVCPRPSCWRSRARCHEALTAYQEAERLAPDSPYVRLRAGAAPGASGAVLARPGRRATSSCSAPARRWARRGSLAPENLDVLRAVGEVYLDLSAQDPAALATAQEALEAVRRGDPDDAAGGPHPGPDLHGPAPAREGGRGPARAGDAAPPAAHGLRPARGSRCCARTSRPRPRRCSATSSASIPARWRRGSPWPSCRAGAATTAAASTPCAARRSRCARMRGCAGSSPGRSTGPATWKPRWKPRRTCWRPGTAGQTRPSLSLRKGLVFAAEGRNREALELLDPAARGAAQGQWPSALTVARVCSATGGAPRP